MTRAAAYLRVSTEAQAGPDRYGLDAQRADIETYARSNGLSVVEWFTDTASGSKLSRPGLNACLDAAARHSFDTVIVAKVDRLSRDLMGALWLRKELLRSNVQVVSVAEPFDDADPAGRLFMQMVSAFAEFERSRITDRLSGGRKQKAKQGGYAGGRAPLGYTATRGTKVLTIDPEKVATVQRVFALRADGLSMERIAATLNSEGQTTAAGAGWHAVQVKRVLDRVNLYKGQYAYSGVIAAKGLQQPILGV